MSGGRHAGADGRRWHGSRFVRGGTAAAGSAGGGHEDRLRRLLDAYTDVEADLSLDEYKSRRATIDQDAAAARTRLAELDDQPVQAPTAAVVAGFSAMWSTLDVDARRDVTAALLTTVRMHADKTVELLPRWGEPVTIIFTKRGKAPQVPAG